MTVESNYAIAISTLGDWLKNLAPVYQPMRRKTKTNRDLHARFFPRFEQVNRDLHARFFPRIEQVTRTSLLRFWIGSLCFSQPL